MGPAKTCPSRINGTCKVIEKGFKCYAEKAEDQYPSTVPAYRQAQEDYWRSTPSPRIFGEIVKKIKGRRKVTKYLRFNESGDFHNQRDIKKLSEIARGLKSIGVTTYGNTARSDLDFSRAEFLVKGSGFNSKNGQTTVIERNEKLPEGYIICPGSCKSCDICKKSTKTNVAYIKH